MGNHVIGLDVCSVITVSFYQGMIYNRSRDKCEREARGLKYAYHHAGVVDNKERLQVWSSKGELIVATLALGTGEDYPMDGLISNDLASKF